MANLACTRIGVCTLLPGFGNEWYGKWMYDPSHEIHQQHVARFGNPAQFGYKDFIPHFTAERYDPDEWAELFANCGASYAGFSLAHHDGFGLWDSDVYRWHVGAMGPKRDLYGELAEALRKQNLRLVAPFHIIRGFNWFLAGWNQWEQSFDADAIERGIAEGWDLFDPEFADFYWVQQTSDFADFFKAWQLKVREVIDKYQPDMMWFDGGKFREDGYEPVALEILAHYLNQSRRWGKEVLVLNKAARQHAIQLSSRFWRHQFRERARPPGRVQPPLERRYAHRRWILGLGGKTSVTKARILCSPSSLIARARGGSMMAFAFAKSRRDDPGRTARPLAANGRMAQTQWRGDL